MSAKRKVESGTEPSFTDAIHELEGILGRIESEAVDVDALATELARAAQLLETCRGKIRKAELEVAQIVQRLEPAEDEKAK
jgi:exodeoxyribonuclease VII small subunit